MKKQTFALYFANRGFFPGELVASARVELKKRVESLGYQTLLMDEKSTNHGAVETPAEGRRYADFLASHRGEFDGVILCLPNFGDETGAVAALRDEGVPILVQAYPDEIGKMGFKERRDAFCGKFSIMDVFHQYGIKATIFSPHVIHPEDPGFATQVHDFAAICRVVKGMKRFVIGAIGARTTAFKTVRFDELALERKGITVETIDLSEVFDRVKKTEATTPRYRERAERMKNYTNWGATPPEAFDNLIKLSLVLDDLMADFAMDAIALRCWIELEKELHVAPCVVLSELNDRGIAAACELDVCNAVAMRALTLASQGPSTCLDWNNNYGNKKDACILFHCGPVPQTLMAAKGEVIDHPMFAKDLGCGKGWGCNVGRIAAFDMSYASAKTENGVLSWYFGEGRMTDDPIEKAFFGCAGVAEIPGLEKVLEMVSRKGFRHHVSVTKGHYGRALNEAFTRYLGFDLVEVEK
jgi:L-fucose isomerase-like protein